MDSDFERFRSEFANNSLDYIVVKSGMDIRNMSPSIRRAIIVHADNE
jgi:hypothetical protein